MTKVFETDLQILLTLMDLTESETYVYDPKGQVNRQDATLFQHFFTEEDLLSLEIAQITGRKITLLVFGPKPLKALLRLAQVSRIIYFSKKRLIHKKTPSEYYLFYNNPNGTMRWIYPGNTTFPSFLNLYNGSGLKAKLFTLAMTTTFRFRMPQIFSSGGFTVLYKGRPPFANMLGDVDHDGFSIFTGTVGENRKAVIELNKNRLTTHFIKFPLQRNAFNLVKNEYEQLKALQDMPFEKLVFPKVGSSDNNAAISVSNVKPMESSNSFTLTSLHMEALSELYHRTHQHSTLQYLKFYKDIKASIEKLKTLKGVANDLSFQKVLEITAYLEYLLHSIDLEKEISVGLAHADFTPWNMFITEGKLHVYDWELAERSMPILFDAFHFIFQSGVLIQRIPFEQILDQITDLLQMDTTMEIIMNFKVNFQINYQLYLLSNISYYLYLYSIQEDLHLQAHWLVDVWMQALETEVGLVPTELLMTQ
ncbi:MAG: hypothetical protein AAFV80_08095 [Bacteroidota bacterium]